MSDKYTYADVIIDPNDERVKVGENYWCSDNPNKVIYDANVGVKTYKLFDIEIDSDYPFTIVDTDIVAYENYPCLIKPKEPQVKYVPFDLSKKEVRDKLRGKWISHKSLEFEKMIYEIWVDVRLKIWYCNGFTSEELFRSYTFLDGSPCGESIEE